MAQTTGESKLIFKAIGFAARAHSGQFRKGTNLPYLLHPLGVMKILIENGADEEVVAAGILHDTTEDAGVSLDEIRNEFGPRVADLVAEASEPDKSETWENRKRNTIARVKTASLDSLLVEAADKLDNIRAIRDDYEKLGDRLWARFNRPRDQQSWYYRGMAQAFLRRLQNGPGAEIAKEFDREVRKVFGGPPA